VAAAAVPVVPERVSELGPELEPGPLEVLEVLQAVVLLLFRAPLAVPAREPARVALLLLPEAQEPAQEPLQEPVPALVSAEAPPQLSVAEP